jgi:hypothetical protein
MTKLLEKAFKEASKLPEVEQNALAKWVIEELEAEEKWEKAFAASEDVLDKLADEALAEHKRGKTKALKIEDLSLTLGTLLPTLPKSWQKEGGSQR